MEEADAAACGDLQVSMVTERHISVFIHTAQQQVSKLRGDLDEALRDADSNSFSPAWREAVEELGVSDLLGDALAEELERVFSRNEITPATAAGEIDAIKQRVDALVDALNEASPALEFFRIGAEELNPGQFEIGFLIPRSVVHDGLGSLGNEFVQLKRILGPFTELAGDGRPDLRVRSLSSSEFQVFLDSTPGVALAFATALERLLAAYERILNDLTLSLNALATRVDRGYNVDVRAGGLPPPRDEEANVQDPIDTAR